jgi:hypothetical protein
VQLHTNSLNDQNGIFKDKLFCSLLWYVVAYKNHNGDKISSEGVISTSKLLTLSGSQKSMIVLNYFRTTWSREMQEITRMLMKL